MQSSFYCPERWRPLTPDRLACTLPSGSIACTLPGSGPYTHGPNLILTSLPYLQRGSLLAKLALTPMLSWPIGPLDGATGGKGIVPRPPALQPLLGSIRTFALEQVDGLPRATMPQVARAVSSLPIWTGVGLDDWEAPALRMMPNSALEALTGILNQATSQVMWPMQVLCQLIVLVTKPSLDDRPICLEPMLARIWHRIHKDRLRCWSRQEAGFWDAAIEGSSALRSMLKSLAWQEAQIEQGRQVVQICWDVGKCYDDIPLVAVALAAVRKGYPATHLCLAILLFLGPRVLAQGDAVFRVYGSLHFGLAGRRSE